MRSRFVKIVLTVIFIFASSVVLYGEKEIGSQWVPMQERVKVWDAVAGKANYTITPGGLEAVFEKDGAKWTIIGANAPIVNPTVYPKDWPVKGNDFEVLVIPEPISNYRILPFTENIENAVKSDVIRITAARDSYEPASFVIRSGNIDLKHVIVEVADLKAEMKDEDGQNKVAVVPKENIDARVVKCWYQAGIAINDVGHKVLTPELLLHDDDLVRVDYDNQVNILRNFEQIEDADNLGAFNIPKRQNKQVWLAIHITEQILPGKYQGKVKIIEGRKTQKELALQIEVLPFALPESMLDYALFYEGTLQIKARMHDDHRAKSEEQMLNDLRDMKAHGLTNATVWHRLSPDKTARDEDWKALKRVLDLRNKIGWARKPLLYLDWKTMDKDDLNAYKAKIESIVGIAESFGIKDVYIYGVDEKSGKELLSLRHQYETVHKAGAKNFVACVEDFIVHVPDLVDIPVLGGDIPNYFMQVIEKLGIKAWSYGNPQAGIEEPETYRRNYGIKLFTKKFSGTCDYVYQQSWNDFLDKKWRSHTMAYPTVRRSIPTLQWEGWREAVNDIRYLTLLSKKKSVANEQCTDRNVNQCRQDIINEILNSKSE